MMNQLTMIIFFTIISYIIGSFPSAYVVVKFVKKMDIREVGSGNIGATNTYRVAGMVWAVLVFLLDMSKGFLPAWYLTSRYGDHPLVFMPVLFILVGHIYSIFLKFSGGKGVATGLGIFFALAPITTLVMLGIWMISMLIFRIVSLSSILAAMSLPIAYYFINRIDNTFYFTLVCSFLVIIMHKANIQRLLTGKEKRIKK